MEKGNEKQSEEVKSFEVQVKREDLTQLITYLQELQVGIAPTEANSSKEFIPSPIAKSRLGNQGRSALHHFHTETPCLHNPRKMRIDMA